MNCHSCHEQIDNGAAHVLDEHIYHTRCIEKRAVVVVDRGWIWAGDVAESHARIRLSRVTWLFKWASVGFSSVIEKPKQSGVELRKVPFAVDIPRDTEIFR